MQCASRPGAPVRPGEARDYLLVHGGAHGGWCWELVAQNLRRHGHRVVTPTLPGLAEKAHLFSDQHSVESYVDFIVDLIAEEDLSRLIVVGHSFGGCVITGVADRVADQIDQLAYLDALVLRDGQCPYDALPAEVAAQRRADARDRHGLTWADPEPTRFGIPADHVLYPWVARHLTPHPASTYQAPLHLTFPVGNGLPVTYIECTSPHHAALSENREWARRQVGWRWLTLETGHDAMITAPSELSRILLDLATQPATA